MEVIVVVLKFCMVVDRWIWGFLVSREGYDVLVLGILVLVWWIFVIMYVM